MNSTLDWSKIKDGFTGFEKLAFTYVKKCFKNSSWKATPATRDGNKDAVAVVVGYQADIMGEQKWWMEAKYSNETLNLTRYRLDATIVSAILEKNVTKIIFVTNMILKPKTISDLRKALSLSTGYDDIKFVCKYDLEYWLFQNPQYLKDFFEEEAHIFKLPELFIINKAEYYDCSKDVLAFKESLRFLQKEVSYRMHCSIYCSKSVGSKIISNPSLSGIRIISDRNIHLNPGENRVTVDFKLTKNFPGKRKKVYNSDHLFRVENEPVISEKLITVSENNTEYFSLEYQNDILNSLKAALEEFNTDHSCRIYDIIGNSGSGKSFIANKFLQLDDCLRNSIYYFEFSNSNADNLIALVNLVIYIHFPYLASEDVDLTYLDALDNSHYISLCLRNLVKCRNDFESLNKTIAGIEQEDEIFPVNLFINSRIIILDNVQKLRQTETDFLLKIIYALYLRKASVFLSSSK